MISPVDGCSLDEVDRTDLPVPDFEAAIKKHHLMRANEVDSICSQTHRYAGLVAGFISHSSVSMLIGDSGLGKSPLAYQLGLCVAAGLPFLGMKTEDGAAIYADYENGLEDSRDMRDNLLKFLDLCAAPGQLPPMVASR